MANTYDHIFTKGPESALPSVKEDGKIRFTTDTGRLFVDGQNARTEISDFIKGMTEDEIKSQLAPLANKIYISSDTNKFMIFNASGQSGEDEWINIANSGQADHADDADEAVHASTADYATNSGTATYANNSGTVNGKIVEENVPSGAKFTDTTYTGTNGISLSGTTFSNSGVRSIAAGGSNGTINVNTNGTTANVAVTGLKALAYKDSLSKSDVGLGNVANLDQSKAIKSITRSGTTFTATAIDGTTSSFTQQDSNTTYAAGTGIALNSGTFSNSGVRSAATGTANGTININTNGTTADVAVKGLKALAYKDSLGKSDVGLGNVANYDQSKAIKSITRSGTTFTATAIDGTTSSFTQQDNNTTYTGSNGITLSGTNFTNSGVRAVATGTSNGTINVNTNGSTANVAVKGLGSAAYTASTAYAAASHTHSYLPLSGGTLTGALTFANNTWNTVGDDVAIGDINAGGTLGIKGLNGQTCIRLVPYSGSTYQTISIDGAGVMSISGHVKAADSVTATHFPSSWIGTLSGSNLVFSNIYNSGFYRFVMYGNGYFTDSIFVITDSGSIPYASSISKTDYVSDLTYNTSSHQLTIKLNATMTSATNRYYRLDLVSQNKV